MKFLFVHLYTVHILDQIIASELSLTRLLAVEVTFKHYQDLLEVDIWRALAESLSWSVLGANSSGQAHTLTRRLILLPLLPSIYTYPHPCLYPPTVHQRLTPLFPPESTPPPIPPQQFPYSVNTNAMYAHCPICLEPYQVIKTITHQCFYRYMAAMS